MSTIGINTMGFYVPPLCMSVMDIVKKRACENSELAERLQNAVKTTGQRFIRFTKKWQDSVTLAAESVLNMAKSISFDTLKFLISATETSVDASKPLASFIIGILEKSGLQIPQNLISYQTQHACAAGAISILQAMAMIRSLKDDTSAIITTSDIARYSKNTTAEITQGSGAVALHISKNPQLIELDIENSGFFSSDVDDFFRPPHRSEARVKGQFSMSCYNTAVYSALEDLARQYKMSLKALLEESDYIVFHIPFCSMPLTALRFILRKKLGYTQEEYEGFIQRKHIKETSEIISHIGNTYTASTFFALGGLLEKHLSEGKDINNKSMLMVSYGSGNTSIVLRGNTTARASKLVETWNLWKRIGYAQNHGADAYEHWVSNGNGENLNSEAPQGQEKYNANTLTQVMGEAESINAETQSMPQELKPSVYLRGLREDEYRVYDVIQ